MTLPRRAFLGAVLGLPFALRQTASSGRPIDWRPWLTYLGVPVLFEKDIGGAFTPLPVMAAVRLHEQFWGGYRTFDDQEIELVP